MKIFKQNNLRAGQKPFRKQGFTLIEMLVVVSVIGILVTVAGYNNSRVLKSSRDSALKIELNELRTAIYRFSLDNGGKFPQQLQDLSGDELRSVPTRWLGSNGSGRYFYDAESGTVFLYDENSGSLSEQTDLAGKKYGEY